MDIKIDNQKLVVTLKNNLVASNLDKQQNAAKKALTENPEIELVELDLTNVNEMDSLGINLVVGLYKELSNQSKKFMVTNSSPKIKNLFDLFRLDSYFEIS